MDPRGGFIPPSCVTPSSDPVPPETAFIGYLAYDAGPFRPNAAEGILEPPSVLNLEKKLRMLVDFNALSRSLAQSPPDDSTILSLAAQTVTDANAVDDADGHATATFAQSIVTLETQEQQYESAYKELAQAKAADDPANQVELAKSALGSFQGMGSFLNAGALADVAQQVLTDANAKLLARQQAAAREQAAAAAAQRRAAAAQAAADARAAAIAQKNALAQQAESLRASVAAQQREIAQANELERERQAELQRWAEPYSAVQKALVLKRFHRLPDRISLIAIGGEERWRWVFGDRYFDFDKGGELLASGSL
jgi:hypothetical protein